MANFTLLYVHVCINKAFSHIRIEEEVIGQAEIHTKLVGFTKTFIFQL